MAARLFGVSVVNASHYDGATAWPRAALMAWKLDEDATRYFARIYPEYKAVLETYFSSFDVKSPGHRGSGGRGWMGARLRGRVSCFRRTPRARAGRRAGHAASALHRHAIH